MSGSKDKEENRLLEGLLYHPPSQGRKGCPPQALGTKYLVLHSWLDSKDEWLVFKTNQNWFLLLITID
jgi:hypothetical protein